MRRRHAAEASTTYPYTGWPVGIYARASSDARETKTSVTDQETAGTRWAAEQHAQVARTYCDNDLSASRFAKKSRGDFDELLADVQAGKLRMIWFWTLSRSQRRLAVFAQLRDLCAEHDVRWVIKGRVYNLGDRGDRLALGVQALMDEDLPDQISANVRLGLAENAARGRPHSHVAYGWRRVYDQNTGELLAQDIHEPEAEVLRDAAAKLLRGATLWSIANDLNAAGLRAPRGGEWRQDSIRKMLLRPALIGKRTHHGQVVGDAIWSAILDEETFYEVRRVLMSPPHVRQHPTTVKYLLSGIALCGKCESPMRTIYPKGYDPKYGCRSSSICATIRRDWLDDYIEDKVFDRLSRPDAIEWLSRPSTAMQVVTAQDDIESAEKRLREWYAAAARGEVTPGGLKAIERDLLAQIESAKERAAVQQVSPVLRAAARPDIAEVWPDWELPRRRAVIRELLEIRVMPVGRGRGRVFDVARVPTRWLHDLPEG